MEHCHRNDPAFIPELDFVMEVDGRQVPIMTLDPICIHPDFKRHTTLEKAAAMGFGAICFVLPLQGTQARVSCRDKRIFVIFVGNF